jgi:phage-related protein
MTSVNFFLDHRGNNPVGDFLDKNKAIKVKASIIIKNIIEFGLISAIPHIKKLSGLPLWEIRILGKDGTRILFVNKIKSEIILLHAFKKKTNQTPIKEINIALNRLKQLPE